MGWQVLHVSRDFLLLAVIAGCLLSLVVIPLPAICRTGLDASACTCSAPMPWGFSVSSISPCSISLVPGLIFLGIMLSFGMHGILYGPQAALIAECFTPRLRYSGSSMGYHLAAITGGGPAPLIATALLGWTGSGYAIAGYIAACAVVGIIATTVVTSN